MSRSVPAALAAIASLALAAPASAQEGGAAETFAGAPDWLRGVYEERGYPTVWSDGERPSAAFDDLLRAVRSAEARGLDPDAYGLSGLERLRREAPAVREQGAALVFAKLAQDLIQGRTDPEIAYQPDFAPQRDRDRADILAAAYDARTPMDHLARATPDNFLVEGMLAARAHYQRLADLGGWPSLPSGLLVEPGQSDAAVPALRDRLRAESFYDGNAPRDDRTLDDGTVQALRAFQRSRSIGDDGVVGPNTIAALNESPSELVRRLDVNIERARWLPSELGDRAALVNAADYTLRLYEDGRQTDRMAVIVGERETQTPVFADTMETVVVNPYWNVPSSILIGEIAPKQVEDPSYISSNDFEVLRGGEVVSPASVDWAAAAAGRPTFRVRQTAGDHNALGRIKFLFPNKYAVYLHDTPADSLFERDVRTFSHGCIRVADPVRFGSWLLGAPEWKLRRMIEAGDRAEITSPPLPVYITYFTAWPGEDGTVRFARDIYDRDDAVTRNLGLTQG